MPYKDKQSEEARKSARKSSAKYRAAHPEKAQEMVQAWQQKHPDYDRRWRYGVTQEEFDRVLHCVQHDLCAVCGKPFESSFDTTLDHDHATGVFRGIVHRKCNRYISHIESNSDLLAKVQIYLAVWKR